MVKTSSAEKVSSGQTPEVSVGVHHTALGVGTDVFE